MFASFIRRAVPTLLGCGLAAAFAADSTTSKTIDLLSQVPPQDRVWVARQIQYQRAVLGEAAVAGSDATAPVLTAFNADSSIEASLAMNPLHVAIKANDDLSGVAYATATAHGPSGQVVHVRLWHSPPAKNLSAKLSSSELSPFLEPGAYTFKSACIYDAAWNAACYSQSALATLGNVNVTINNKKGFDVAPPSLQAGQILTPKVSLSGTHPGIDGAMFVGLTVDAADAGTSALAGVRYASASFCLLDGFTCFSIPGTDSGEPRRAATKVRIGTQLQSGSVAPGKYHLQLLTIGDYAGISQGYRGTKFGGDTDFSLYFPSTTITVDP